MESNLNKRVFLKCDYKSARNFGRGIDKAFIVVTVNAFFYLIINNEKKGNYENSTVD